MNQIAFYNSNEDHGTIKGNAGERVMAIRTWLLIGLIWLPGLVFAGTIPFEQFRMLLRGMNEAEVIYRVGPPDFVSAAHPYWPSQRIWYYIPKRTDPQKWMTTITFSEYGVIRDIRREKQF